MLLNGWWKWLACLLMVLMEGPPQTVSQLEWPQVQKYVTARLKEDPITQTLQDGLSQSYVYAFFNPIARYKRVLRSPLNIEDFSARSGLAAADAVDPVYEKEDEKMDGEIVSEGERSPDAQARFIGKFKEWYKEKEMDKEDDENQHIVISTHHSAASHDSGHYQSDHGHNHGFDHGHGNYRGHGNIHLHGYPYQHGPIAPMYPYPPHGQHPVVQQPIIIESGRGHGSGGGGGGGGKGKGKGSASKGKGTIYTETVIVTQSVPVVQTQTVTEYTYHKPSYSYNPTYATPSHVYIQTTKPTYATPSQVYIQTPGGNPPVIHSSVYIQQPQTEYVAVSVESDDHGWGWGWDLFGKGKGTGGGHHGKGEGQVVYVMEKPQTHYVTPQLTTTRTHYVTPQLTTTQMHYVTPQLMTTHVVVQQEVAMMSHIDYPSTSEVMIMTSDHGHDHDHDHSIKNGFEKVKETFKALGDGIKGVGEDIKDKISKGVDKIKSKLTSHGDDDQGHHYIMVEKPHSVVMVQPDITQTRTIVVQKPVVQTVVQKPIIQTVTVDHPSYGSHGHKASAHKVGGIIKGLFHGHTYGKGESKGNDKIIIVNAGGGGHVHQSYPHPYHNAGCTHCG